jgi:hypothetical protein
MAAIGCGTTQHGEQNVSSKLQRLVHGMTEQADDDHAGAGKYIRGSQTKKDELPASVAQVLQTLGRCYPHFQEEQAEHALEERDEELVVGLYNLVALRTADEAGQDAAKQKHDTRIEENLSHQFAGTALMSDCGDWSACDRCHHRQLRLS